MQKSKLKELLSELTLDEKVGELLQLPSSFFSEGNITGPAASLGISEDTVAVAGSCLSVVGAEKLINIQKKHIEEHPHHIPMLFMADIINGYQTIFPIPLAQSCTFDLDLVESCASISAKEAAAAGVHVTFSPMADLVRDPRWGRVMESTGESSYLNGAMAVSMIHGYQGHDNDLTKNGHIASCLKHFAAYGAPEGGRDYNNTEISERSLMEDYLPAYNEAISAGCELVMTSFNTLNRIPSSANQYLLKDILREKMHFKGVVISDWQAIFELIPHGIATDEMEAARLALYAGVDIDMATSIYAKNIQKLIKNELFTENQLDNIVMRILQLKNKLGLFENPYKDANVEDEKKLLLCDTHKKVAKKCAEDSFVLLKNEHNFLPLQSSSDNVAFIGPYLDNHLLNGSWSFFSNDEDTVTIKESLQKIYPDADMTFSIGASMVNPGVSVIGFQKAPPKETIQTKEQLEKAIEEAVSIAYTADKVVLFLGEHREYSGEAASRADITIPACQIQLFDAVYSVNQNICVVLFSGRPLDIHYISKKAKSILEVWLPGTEGANAIAKTLYGDSIPSGKLTMSFPYCAGQIPVYHNHMNTGRPFHGNYLTERFCSKYIDIPNEPLFPFGYGLSYSSFSISPVKLSSKTLVKKCEGNQNNTKESPDHIEAYVDVTNTGKYTASEVIQMYIQDEKGSVTRPIRELKSFVKVSLSPGETKKITFCITENMLRFYNIKMDYCSEPGDFNVFIGNDSTTENMNSFVLI